MNEWLSNQLGKVMLALAVVWCIGAAVMNAPQQPPGVGEESKASDWKATQVKLKIQEVDPSAQTESFFIALSDLPGPERKIFPTEVAKVEAYNPVELEVPDATVARSPMLVPAPGPNLPGAGKLPRWGEELPPIPAPPPPAKGSNAGNANPANTVPIKPN
jgi:hypothetical protein